MLLKISSLFLLGLVLLFPLYLIKDSLSFADSSDLLFLLHRILGLYAFSIIFIQIILGSGRSLLGKIFSPSLVLKTHMNTGKLALLLVLLHPTLLYLTFFTKGDLSYVTAFMQGESLLYFAMGVTALILILISGFVAIYRLSIGPKWVYIHRINYLIFWLIFIHSFKLGVDVQNTPSQMIYLLYGTVVGALTIRKIFLWVQRKNTPLASFQNR